LVNSGFRVFGEENQNQPTEVGFLR